jgi:hypothetical protein
MPDRPIHSDRESLEGGLQRSQSDSNTELDAHRSWLEVPENVGNHAGVLQEALELIARGDNELRQDGVAVAIV